jgi:hypothetical protein
MNRSRGSTTISRLAHSLVACLALGCQALAAEQTITINHLTGLQDPSGVIALKRDEVLTIKITETKLECFQFNEKTVEPPPAPTGVQAQVPTPPPPEVVTMSIIHDGLPHNYVIEASFRPGVTSCGLLAPKSWTITAQTYSWAVAFAGGFTGDRLIDPVFSLEAGKDPTDPSKSGFFIRRSRTQQSFMTLGAAAMVHLYHTDPNALVPLLKRINWVPLSFGLGVNNQSDTRYFLGTGIRFDTKLFLIAGVAVGSVARLPNGLAEDGFTANANALSTLGKRTEAQFFLALSYAFIDTGASPLQALFKDVKPTVQNAQTGQKAEFTPIAIQKTADGVYSFTVGNKGPDPVKGAKVTATITGAASLVTWDCQGNNGGVCSKPSGQGDLAKELVDLPKGASAVYTLHAAGGVSINASVEAPEGVSAASQSGKFPSS